MDRPESIYDAVVMGLELAITASTAEDASKVLDTIISLVPYLTELEMVRAKKEAISNIANSKEIL